MFPSFISALRNEDDVGSIFRAFANNVDGEAGVFTYSFRTSSSSVHRVLTEGDTSRTFQTFSAVEKTTVRTALAKWAAVADVKFVETTSPNADIVFGQHDIPDPVLGYAGTMLWDKLDQDVRGTDIWLDGGSFLTTSLGRQVAVHEIGHALGLKHPFEGAHELREAELDQSIMSYEDGIPGPGLFDIAAIQSIYGPAQKRLGSNIYKIGIDKVIWDGGGRDAVSASYAKAAATIDLNDGSWNFIGKKAVSLLSDGQSWLGHFTQIEIAVGSRYSDRITGNELDNTLKGGSGNDVINGRAGADTLMGQNGRDSFVFARYSDMGNLNKHDSIRDFTKVDKIDLRGLHTKFIGNAESDSVLAHKAGQFYFNIAQHELRFDADGDGVVDHAIGLSATLVSAGQFIL